ncbi:MAG: hypothetical protein QOG57_6272, partial [Pseudonocardiales bacterium]|nr:hypothetical protein [Pseudonocardiales bacterium]
MVWTRSKQHTLTLPINAVDR